MIDKRLRPIVIAALYALLAPPPAAIAQSPAATPMHAAGDEAHAALAEAEWRAIQKTIGDQLAALKAGDGARAFSYASPGIRDRFGDPDTFLAMVRGSYSSLLDARYTEFLEGAVIDGRTIQPLRLVLNDETVLVALYEMQRDDGGGWRIAGCVLAPSTVRSI
jgi:hypothetical protein